MTSPTSTSTTHPSLTASLIQPSCSLMTSSQLSTSCSTIPAETLPLSGLKLLAPSNIFASALEFPAPLNLWCSIWKNANPHVPNHLLLSCRPHLSEHPFEKATQQSDLHHPKFMVTILKLALNTTWDSCWILCFTHSPTLQTIADP